MIERIKKALKAAEIADYTINETCSESVECFFIRRNLDLKRRTNLREYTVTVFCPFEREEELSDKNAAEGTVGRKRMLGSSAVQISPEMDDNEIEAAVRSAYHAASFVANPWYELVSGTTKEGHSMEADSIEGQTIPAAGTLAGRSPEENMKAMAEALFAADMEEEHSMEEGHSSVFLNSAEIFSKRTARHIVNARGVDVSYETCEVSGEYVVQCTAPQDVETYHSFSYRELDTEALRRDVKEALEMTRARAKAVSAPKAGEYRIILSGEEMRTFFQYYISRSGSGMIYQKYSGYRTGMQVQAKNAEDIKGDALTIVLKAKDPYSHEGIPMKDRTLLEDGVLRTIHGDSRFAYYLGIEPTGTYQSISVPVGDMALSEMKSGAYLHIVSFSDFQMDAFTGHFGGEIRLAFLCDGDTVTPVTGGSVNGSIMEVQENMIFSRERYKNGNYEGPFAVSLEGIKIAGRG